jgi:hypothetical protein
MWSIKSQRMHLTFVEFSCTILLNPYCYHPVQNLLSSRLLQKTLITKIYKTIIVTVVLYGCDAWSLILRREYRLRGCEDRVLRIFGPKKTEVGGGEAGQDRVTRSFINCTLHQILFG